MKNLAYKYHAGQSREGKEKLPYIVHPEAVAENLIAWGENPESPAIQIAWGHDLLEDTSVTEQEILSVSSEYILNCIKSLTRPEHMKKLLYLRTVAACGDRNILLVKISDRISNSRDFTKWKGNLHAFRYLHEADELFSALEKYSADPVVKNALNAWEEFDFSIRESARLDSLRGCLIGGAIGDALGSPVEFLSKQDIEKIFHGPIADYVEFPGGTGAITDDTQMTLFTIEGLLRANVRSKEKGICDPVAVMNLSYQRWLKTQGCISKVPEKYLNNGWLINEKQLFSYRAPGMTCISSLEQNASDYIARNNSKGCGTVMRMAPAGLFFRDPGVAYSYGCKYSAITHGHPTGITAGGAFSMLISYLIEGMPLESALDYVEDFLETSDSACETLAAIRNARSAERIEELGEGWVAEEALAIGIYCALHYQKDFRQGVLAAVNISGDSDSTGAIAGNILGLLNGEGALPENWCRNLREYAIVSQAADDLYSEYESDPEGHITENWWKKYPGY